MSKNSGRSNLRSSWQEHDLWYVIDRLQEEHYKKPWAVLQEVVAACKAQIKPSEGREKLLAAAKETMRSTLRRPTKR